MTWAEFSMNEAIMVIAAEEQESLEEKQNSHQRKDGMVYFEDDSALGALLDLPMEGF